MAAIRTREDPIRTNIMEDFFSFAASVLSDINRKMEGGFRDEEDRNQTSQLFATDKVIHEMLFHKKLGWVGSMFTCKIGFGMCFYLKQVAQRATIAHLTTSKYF